MKPDILALASRVHEHFSYNKLTLSVAESCTGGLISHYITAVPGASAFFRAGIVSYSGEAKKDLLNVPEEVIEDFGMISRETVVEMAERIRLLAKTDYSAASTGNLGPDALENKGKGLIYIAACKEGKTITRELNLTGSREENREDASMAALELLLELIGPEK